MNFMQFKTLWKDKIPKIFIAVTLIVFLVYIIFYYFIVQYNIVVAEQKATVAAVDNSLETHFYGRLLALRVLANDASITASNTNEWLQHLSGVNSLLNFKASGVYDVNGDLIVGTSRFRLENIKNSTSFATVLAGEPAISNRSDFLGFEDAYVRYQVPVYSPEKAVKFVLVAEEPISEIANTIDMAFKSSPRNYVFVIDNNNNFISHPRLRSIYPENETFNQRLKEFFQEYQGTFVKKSMMDDYNKLFVVSSLKYTNWKIVVARSTADIYGEIFQRSLPWIVFLFLVFFSLGMVVRSISLDRYHKTQLQNERMERMTCVNRLAAGVAHEIRNPLTAIKGFIQLISNKRGESVPARYIEVLLSEIQRIEDLINEFRLLAKPLKQVDYENINMVGLIDDVYLLMENQTLSKNVKFECTMPAKLCVKGDASQLKQVLINLVRNAIEAVSYGGHVLVSLERAGSKVILKVEDDGEGMEECVLKKLGTAFFTTKDSGTGLGLSVSFNIVENHGGKIEVESAVGKGSTFSVVLPYIAQNETKRP